MEVRRIPGDSPDALRFVDAMIDELSEVYGGFDEDANTPSATPEDFSPPGGAFVALYEADRAVAGGGVKRFADGVGEIKRMYVVPDRRGAGLGRALLAALEDAARGLGYAVVRLDTGRLQPGAERMYRSAGYDEIGDYNGNVYASFWGEKRLSAPPGP
jgi:GNAT superfamily N-acetyltransferase